MFVLLLLLLLLVIVVMMVVVVAAFKSSLPSAQPAPNEWAPFSLEPLFTSVFFIWTN